MGNKKGDIWNAVYDYGKHGLSDETIERLLDLIEGTRWIPVSERLPAPFQGALISNGQWVEFALWGCGEIADTKNYQLCKSATHWMPLPKPPEVE